MKSIQPSPIPPLRGDVSQWSNDLSRYIEKHLQDHFYDIQNIIAPTEDTDDAISFWEKSGTTLTTKPAGMSVNLGSAAFAAGAGTFSSLATNSITSSSGVISTLHCTSIFGQLDSQDTRLLNVDTPIDDHDGVNKEYVDESDADIVDLIDAKANRELDNLRNVAINESLISDTDNTDDLGSSLKKWRDLCIGRYVIGNLTPNISNTYNLGTSSLRWYDEEIGHCAYLQRALIGGVRNTENEATLLFHFGCNDNEATTTVIDTSGNGRHGGAQVGADGAYLAASHTDDIHYTPAKLGSGSFDFNGVDVGQTGEFVDAEDILALDSMSYTSACSFACWFNADAAIVDKDCIFSKRGSNGQNTTAVFELFLDYDSANTKIIFHAAKRVNTTLSENTIDTGGGSISTGTWYHIVAIYNNRAMRLYLNGVLVSSGTFLYTPTTAPIQHLVIAGNKSSGNVNNHFDGKIDDVRFYSGALTEDEILFIYNGGTGTENELPTGARTVFVNAIGTSSTVYTGHFLDSLQDLIIEGDLEVQTNTYLSTLIAESTIQSFGSITGENFIATCTTASGTQPYATISTTENTNLNAELWGGVDYAGTAIAIGDVLYGSTAGHISNLVAGTAGQLLRTAGNAAAPAWTGFTVPVNMAVNSILATNTYNVCTAITAAAGSLHALIHTAANAITWNSATGTGLSVFATTPTITTPVITNPTFGNAADADITLTFNTSASDGLITWRHDLDYFEFNDDILLLLAENVYFRTTAIGISSVDPGHLDLAADVSIDLNTPAISTTATLSVGALTATSYTIALHTLDENEWHYLDGQNQAVKTTDSPIFTNLTIGLGAIGVDYTQTFHGESNDCIITWKEDEIYLNIDSGLAVGGGNSATGQWSFSSGTSSVASGAYAVAMGTGVIASGISSIACGDSGTSVANQLLSSGTGSFVAGRASDQSTLRATGDGAAAFGFSQSTPASTMLASGLGSFIFGHAGLTGQILAASNGSFAGGRARDGSLINASGGAALALGWAKSGNDIVSSGTGSWAGGYATTANITAGIGDGAFAFGKAAAGNILASGSGSFAFGDDVEATGENTFLFGIGTDVNTASSFNVGFGGLDLQITTNSADFQDCTVVTTGTVSGASLIATTTDILYTGADKFFHTTGTANVFMGVGAGAAITTGTDNYGIGTGSMWSLTEGGYNTCLGAYTLGTATASAFGNTLVGAAGICNSMTSGDFNVGVGFQPLNLLEVGSNNVCVGSYAGLALVTASGSVHLGHCAGKYETAGNKLFIDNQDRTDEATSRTSSLIYGIFDAAVANQLFRINGVLNIANEYSFPVVDGAVNQILQTDGSGAVTWVDIPAAGGAANAALDNLAGVAINTSLVSDTDITDDLGTGDIRWKDGWLQTLNSGLTAGDTFKIRGYDVDGAVYVDILTVTSNNSVTATLSADVTGNLTGNVTGNASGSSGSCTGLAATATALATTRAINGVNFDGSAAITPNFIMVVKTSDETIQSDAVVGDDNALFFTMTASKTYIIRGRVFYSTTANADFKWRHAGSQAATQIILARQHNVQAGVVFVTAVDTAYSAADIAMAGGLGSGYVQFEATILNGNAGSVFSFKWAQNTSTAANTTVEAGSYLEYKQID